MSVAAGVRDPTSVSNPASDRADYADRLLKSRKYADYTFDDPTVELRQTIQGAGGPNANTNRDVFGQLNDPLDARGTFNYAFLRGAVAGAVGPNAARAAMEVLREGTDWAPETVVTNAAGEVLSSTRLELTHDELNGSRKWTTSYAYDNRGRLLKTTLPSGLQQLTDYYDGTGGSPDGYVKDTALAKPALEAVQSYVTYEQKGDDAHPVWLVKDSETYAAEKARAALPTHYGDLDLDGQATVFTYVTDSAHEAHVTTMTTELPLVSDEGGGTSFDSTSQTFDSYGRLHTATDADGYTTTYEYDDATGLATDTTQQVSKGTAGTPAATIHTSVDHWDVLGRPKELRDALGQITQVQYTDGLYDNVVVTTSYDAGDAQVAPSTRVDRDDQAATVTTTTSAADGSVQSKTVDHLDLGGRTVSTDRYSNVAAGTHYTTSYRFDALGRQDRVTNAVGTITQTDYDALGRPVTVSVGVIPDKDTRATTMTATTRYVYSHPGTPGGPGVGDGDLIRTIQDPGTGALRYTDVAYDWRDRAVATKVYTPKDVNQPLTYTALDNLGQATATLTYAGYGLQLYLSSYGLPASYAPNLKGATSAAYDDRGRVYRTSLLERHRLEPAVGPGGGVEQPVPPHRLHLRRPRGRGEGRRPRRHGGQGRLRRGGAADDGVAGGRHDRPCRDRHRVRRQRQRHLGHHPPMGRLAQELPRQLRRQLLRRC